jgi:hypothetical protein
MDLGCGSGASRFGNGATIGGDPNAAPGSAVTPSVNGVTVPAAVAARAPAKKPAATRAQQLAACNKRAKKLPTAKRRAAAKRSCAKRFDPKRAAKA